MNKSIQEILVCRYNIH